MRLFASRWTLWGWLLMALCVLPGCPVGPTYELPKTDNGKAFGNQYQDVLNRRAANPERFDANHPAMVPALDAGKVPWGVKPFPAAPKYALSYVPKLGTKAFAYGTPVKAAGVKPALRQIKASSTNTAANKAAKS